MIGTKLAHYEITSHLGSGGMGDVYQATDSKLGGNVAIKFLPEAFSHDIERVARFEREARVLASLNHPNIAAIHGLEESGERKFLVMELVEGETLAERIERGPIPVDESLGIAKQICEALEAAHDKGIIHRDLKPANVKITPDGKVKVLDFGLAKAMEQAPGTTLSNSPTLISMAATNGGVILGTAAYMSPEQAKGREVERRTDIFAFGCVLYEMLTGRATFEGEDITEILSRVLQREPDWTLLPPNVPLRIRDLLRHCLQKDVKKRRQTATDIRIDIEDALAEPVATVAPPVRGSLVAWIAAGVFALVGIFAILAALRPSPPPPEMRLQVVTPPGADLAYFAISPDGRKVVFLAPSEGRSRLWLRPLDSETAQPLLGTECGTGPFWPFWSPDSQSIGFFGDGQLKRIDIVGGLVRTSAPLGLSGFGGAWNNEGTILFALSGAGPLYRMPASGGEVTEATHLDPPRQAGHVLPQFLPDGRHFLFFSWGESQGVYMGSLDSMVTRRLFDADAAAVFAAPDHILFTRQGALLAQRLDPKTLQLAAEPLSVSTRIAVDILNAHAALSASATGLVAYRTGAEERQLVWFNRSGQQIGKVGVPDVSQPGHIQLSPDGLTVALDRTVNGNIDVWLIEILRGVLRRFTFDATVESAPLWSPDGSRIVFGSDPKGVMNLYEKPVNGDGVAALLVESSQDKVVADWSSDGRFILYRDRGANTGNDLWVKPLFSDGKPIPVAQTAFAETTGRFSYDSHWIAYQSNESGRNEVYVLPFLRPSGPGGKSQISTSGGTIPLWRRDGHELFYLAPDNRVMAVPITLNDSTVTTGTPAALFSLPPGSDYRASPDGQRFLINMVTKDSSPITILQNWHPEHGK